MYIAARSMKDNVKQLVNLSNLTWFTAAQQFVCSTHYYKCKFLQ